MRYTTHMHNNIYYSSLLSFFLFLRAVCLVCEFPLSEEGERCEGEKRRKKEREEKIMTHVHACVCAFFLLSLKQYIIYLSPHSLLFFCQRLLALLGGFL